MGERFGPYELLEPLASGGMAKVYRARMVGALGFEKIVAIKFMLPGFAQNPDAVKMFVDEARLAATLSHANIVGILDFGERDGSYYIAMEYVAGANLRILGRRALETRRLMTPTLATYVVAEVARGLDYAHKKTDAEGRPLFIVHRDVSPQNIVASWSGEVKILDFGIARSRGRSFETNAGTIKGKYSYMSPEQAAGLPVDHRSDLFSLGCVYYELLTGMRAFPSDGGAAILAKVRHAEFTPPNEVMPQLPSALIAILMRAMARSPESRYSSAAAMLDDLSRYVAEQRAHGANDCDAGAVARWVEGLFRIADSDLTPPPVSHPQGKPKTGTKVLDAPVLPGWEQAEEKKDDVPPATPAAPRIPDRSLSYSVAETRQEEEEEASVFLTGTNPGASASLASSTPYPSVVDPVPGFLDLSSEPPSDEPVDLEAPPPARPTFVAPPTDPLPPAAKEERTTAPPEPRMPERTAFPSPRPFGGVAPVEPTTRAPSLRNVARPPTTPATPARPAVADEGWMRALGPRGPAIVFGGGAAVALLLFLAIGLLIHASGKAQPTPTPVAATPETPRPTPTAVVVATPARPSVTPLVDVHDPSTRPVGILDVSSTPPGAQIVLDGKPITETPALLPNLAAPHRYLLALHKDGYADWSREVDVVDDEAVEIVAPLAPPEVPGKLRIDIPARLTAYVDGRRVGVGPSTVTVDAQPGSHQLRLRDANDVLVKEILVQVNSGSLSEPDMVN